MSDWLRPITDEERDAWQDRTAFPPTILVRNRRSSAYVYPFSEARYIRADIALAEIERLRRENAALHTVGANATQMAEVVRSIKEPK